MSIFSRFQIVVLMGLFLIAACSSEPDSQPSTMQSLTKVTLPNFDSISTEDVYAYSCGDSLEFATHVTPDSSWLFLPDTTLKVRPVTAGSGAKYQGSGYIYWSKGNEAILQQPTGSFLTCQTVPREKSWQAARIRGVDFRAMGQEPGWQLEITHGGQIKYVGNYGNDSLTVATPEQSSINNQGAKFYEAQTESRSINIKITDDLCTDSMNGFSFPSTVTVSVDGETYRGCGRQLNSLRSSDS
ncbi:MAG: MliC family protein [Fodinibius sp.]|nr:MliC family protein [Fodinibius sp.]